MSGVNPTDFEPFALELAAAAAEVSLPLFQAGTDAANKAGQGAFDPVTQADRDAEAAIRRLIGHRFPDHGVIGEEYGEDRPDADWVWVLDPIDGTRAFISGLPLWTTLVALLHKGRPVLGAIAQPVLGEVFIGTAARSRRVMRDGEAPIRTRPCAGLSEATLATTDPYLFSGEDAEAWRAVHAQARLTRFGCDAYAYAMVAAGRIDGVMENGLKLWDWAALGPVIEGAGGRLCGWDGGVPHDGRVLAAGDPALLEAMLSHIA